MERQMEEVELNDDGITHASNLPELCRRCYQHLDVDKLLNPRLRIRSRGRPVMNLDELGTDSSKKRCLICGCMVSFFHRGGDRKRLNLFEGVTLFEKAHNPKLVEGNQRFLAFCETLQLLDEAGFLFPISRSGDQTCPVHVVDCNAISYCRITKWLDDCATNHHATCVQVKDIKHSVQLYVLNCLTNTIVSLPFGHKYVALSYVWGKAADLAHDPMPPIGNVQDSNWLHSEIPLTIRDSMEATRRLGYRYLWVDRYCIPQVDISQRHEAISNMGQVYAGAVFTIVALHGDSVHAGLPGVSTRLRSGVQQVSVPNGQLRWTFPSLTSVIDTSVWSTRGWTFQEFRLSRRCLFFTKYQVYFSCSAVTLSEALPQPPLTSTLARGSRSIYIDRLSAPYTIDSRRSFFQDRLIYTNKTLSYENDILNAFRAIIGLHAFVTIWGIPIPYLACDLDPCAGFAIGLLWARTKGPSDFSRRRPGFPTWSWTSVFGEIEQRCETVSQYLRFVKCVRETWVKSTIKVEIPDTAKSLAETIKNTNSKTLPESSTSIIIEGDVLRLTQVSVDPYEASFHFQDGNGILDSQRLLVARVDVTGPGEQPAATKKALEGVQDALIVVEWSPRQLDTEVTFMLLRWVGDNIAERVGLADIQGIRTHKASFESLPRRRVKFELR